MLTSSYVFGIAHNCDPIIQEALQCSSQMNQAIRDLYSFWNKLGATEFHDHCLQWIQDMSQFQQSMNSIKSSLNSYGQSLQMQERQRAVEAAARQAAAIAAAQQAKQF